MHKIYVFLMNMIATWFFTGRSKYAPGTMGSLATLPVVYVLYPYGCVPLFLFACVAFFVGWFVTDFMLKTYKVQDPGYVVIDEVVGQTIPFIFVSVFYPLTWWMLFAGFILFRIFDIKKMGLVAYFDKKLHNAFGVMMDDVVAGVYASMILAIICFIII